MGRATWLTWKMHRFEVVAAAVLMALIAVSAIVVGGHITALGIDASCWPRTEDGNWATPACDAAMERLWPLMGGGEGQLVRLALAFVGPVAGLLLAVPVVARELELRTTALAWSLEGRRGRWLASRTLPMLGVGLVGLAILGVAGSVFFDALRSVNEWPYIHETASAGVGLVARGVMAFGIALLVGAITGRTLPALVVSGVLVLAWVFGGIGVVQGQLTEQFAVWQQEDQEAWRQGPADPYLEYVAGGTFDVSKPGAPGEPGARFDDNDAYRQMTQACGEPPDDDQGDSPEYQAWATCADPVWNAAYAPTTQWQRIVPGDRWGAYVAADVGLNLLVGVVAIVLTVLVVARRRPG